MCASLLEPWLNKDTFCCICLFSSIQVDSIVCYSCRHGDGEDCMLLCDVCNASYHTYCLVPPLRGVPPGDWRCPPCVAKVTQGVICSLVCSACIELFLYPAIQFDFVDETSYLVLVVVLFMDTVCSFFSWADVEACSNSVCVPMWSKGVSLLLLHFAQECNKPQEAFGFEQADKVYSLHTFQTFANRFKGDYFGTAPHVSFPKLSTFSIRLCQDGEDFCLLVEQENLSKDMASQNLATSFTFSCVGLFSGNLTFVFLNPVFLGCARSNHTSREWHGVFFSFFFWCFVLLQLVPMSDVEQEFWRLVQSIEDDVSSRCTSHAFWLTARKIFLLPFFSSLM